MDVFDWFSEWQNQPGADVNREQQCEWWFWNGWRTGCGVRRACSAS